MALSRGRSRVFPLEGACVITLYVGFSFLPLEGASPNDPPEVPLIVLLQRDVIVSHPSRGTCTIVSLEGV